MMENILVGRAGGFAAGRMLTRVRPMAGEQLSPCPSPAGAHDGMDGADVASARSDGADANLLVCVTFPFPYLEAVLRFWNRRLYASPGCTPQLSQPMGTLSALPLGCTDHVHGRGREFWNEGVLE